MPCGDCYRSRLLALLLPFSEKSALLCVPKIRFCNIDGEGRQGQVLRQRRRGAQWRDGEGRPCPEIDGSSPHYNRRHIGPLPASIQLVQIFTAAIVSTSHRTEQAQRLIAFLTFNSTEAAIKKPGMDPVNHRYVR